MFMNIYDSKPEPFFTIVLHDLSRAPGLTGAFAGFEGGKWRYADMAEHLLEWLPEFALKYSDLEDINSGTARRALRTAAKTVYNTPKYQRRGEFGEILLHALLREIFDSQPAISKIYYKSSVNETVKGFDAVHIVENGDSLELWLGEVKFYKDINSAISEVVAEMHVHLEHDYLKNEFILIAPKIDDNWEHANSLKKLISSKTSLDTVFKQVCIPVLLTYESDSVNAHTEMCKAFELAISVELNAIHKKFLDSGIPSIKIHLFLVPMGAKQLLIDALHSKLEGLQR